MPNVYKVLVTGPFNAGKTEFIRTVSDIPIVCTDRSTTDALSHVKAQTTVAMDYGQVRLEQAIFHLFGTPGQLRFDFMWDILSREMQALVVLVDSSDRDSFVQAKRMIRSLRRKSKAPCLVVANKQDGRRPLSAEAIKEVLGLEESTRVVPCVASDRASVCKVLRELEMLIE